MFSGILDQNSRAAPSSSGIFKHNAHALLTTIYGNTIPRSTPRLHAMSEYGKEVTAMPSQHEKEVTEGKEVYGNQQSIQNTVKQSSAEKMEDNAASSGQSYYNMKPGNAMGDRYGGSQGIQRIYGNPTETNTASPGLGPSSVLLKQKSPESKKNNHRGGKWSDLELEYVNTFIKYYEDGLVDVPDGSSLRQFLSYVLQCTPMRITKKLGKEKGGGIGNVKRKKILETSLDEDEYLKRREEAGNHVKRLEYELRSQIQATETAQRGLQPFYGDDQARAASGFAKIHGDIEDDSNAAVMSFLQSLAPSYSDQKSKAQPVSHTEEDNSNIGSDNTTLNFLKSISSTENQGGDTKRNMELNRPDEQIRGQEQYQGRVDDQMNNGMRQQMMSGRNSSSMQYMQGSPSHFRRMQMQSIDRFDEMNFPSSYQSSIRPSSGQISQSNSNRDQGFNARDKSLHQDLQGTQQPMYQYNSSANKSQSGGLQFRQHDNSFRDYAPDQFYRRGHQNLPLDTQGMRQSASRAYGQPVGVQALLENNPEYAFMLRQNPSAMSNVPFVAQNQFSQDSQGSSPNPQALLFNQNQAFQSIPPPLQARESLSQNRNASYSPNSRLNDPNQNNEERQL